MNKVILAGNLTFDCETTILKSKNEKGVEEKKTVTHFSIAVNNTNKDGEKLVDYFNITVWNDLAKSCQKYLKKGDKVLIEGRLQNRSYEDKNDNIKRYVTDIVASRVEFLTPKKSTDNE